MNMEELYEKILWEGYGLKFRGGTRTRTGLVCRTDRGLRELKKPRGNIQGLRFACDVKAQLEKNGFSNISRFYPAADGEPFYQKDGIVYILEELMPTEVLEEKDTAAFCLGAKTLGQMHLAAKGLSSAAADWEAERLPGLYAKRRGELAKIRRRNDRRGSYDAIDLLLLRQYDTCMAQAAEAEALLREGGYAAAVGQAEQEGAFCHNAFKGESLRLTPTQEVFVGNFDKCISELPIADLAAYLRRYLKKTGGTAEGAEQILAAYEKAYPLSAAERTILRGMLLYPEKFLRLINEYYNRRRACVSPAMQERLAEAAEEGKKGQMLAHIIGGE